LLLVRHAEPACGDDDPLLSCAGLEQAERLGDRLYSLHFAAVYAAPERRAQQTARVLGEAVDCDAVIVGDLRELEYMPVASRPRDRGTRITATKAPSVRRLPPPRSASLLSRAGTHCPASRPAVVSASESCRRSSA
jgi:hypothetical protein